MVFTRKLKFNQMALGDKAKASPTVKPVLPETKSLAPAPKIPKSSSVGSDLAKLPNHNTKRPSLPTEKETEEILLKKREELLRLNREHWKIDPSLVQHKGGCHCGAVRFEIFAPDAITVKECNCSFCHKKQMKHFTVPMMCFKLTAGHDSLKTYSFNSHKAKHNFCSVCGVETFFIPRDNPEGYAIALNAIDEGSIKKYKTEKIDGKNKKDTSKHALRRFSKDSTKS